MLQKMNVINVATDYIGHEVTKKPKPSHAGKTKANVYGMTNMDTR